MTDNYDSSQCPLKTELSQFLAGEISGASFESLHLHIDSCSRCQDELAAIARPTDAVVNMIAGAQHVPPVQLEASLHEKLERMRHSLGAAKASDPSLPTLNVNTIVRDYQILELIGEGGMGCVYRAIHTRLNRQVAIKVLRQDRVNSQEAITRFSREMQLIAKLDHPNIVKATDAGEQDGLHYLVMEYLAGVDVARLLRGPITVSIGNACQIAQLAALAMESAHQQMIIHRDIKPSNLLVMPDGSVKILDLGLAQFFDLPSEPAVSRADQAVGTLGYMSPEQLHRSGEITAQADIFSLGVTLHEVITGLRPQGSPENPNFLAEIARDRRPDLDDRLRQLISEMTSPLGSDRPSSMNEVIERLEPFVHSADLSKLVADHDYWAKTNSLRSKLSEQIPLLAPVDAATKQAVFSEHRDSSSMGRSLVITTRQQSQSILNGGSKLVRWIVGPLMILVMAIAAWQWIEHSKKDTKIAQPDVSPKIEIGFLDVAALGDVADQLLSAGAVFITNNDSHEKLSVAEGINELSPGVYSITFDGPESFVPMNDIQIAMGATRKLQLTTSLTNSFFQSPTIPSQVGTYAAYQGTIWHAGWPPEVKLSFHLRLHVLSIETPLDGPEIALIRIDTVSHHPSGDFQETGYLKVDRDLWQNENRLAIKEGFVRAQSDSVTAWMESHFPEKSEDFIVVPFDASKDNLGQIANDAMPEHRLSLHDVLALFFGDGSKGVAAEAIRGLRPMLLASGQRNFWLEPIANGAGNVLCLVVSSRTKEDPMDTFGYRMARRTAEPFGFVRMEVELPMVKAVCAVIGSRLIDTSTSEYEEIAQACIDLDGWAQKKYFWDRAGIPNRLGSTTWQGKVSVANGTPQIVTATARALGTEIVDNQSLSWIEVEVSSTNNRGESPYWEAVRLLVDAQEYQSSGKFIVNRGWLACGDKETVFEIPSSGDLTDVIDQRIMLSETPNFNRFSALDALSMLFAAEFKPLSMMSVLRREIGAVRVGMNPKRTSTLIQLGTAPPILGELWESPPIAPVAYQIRRTPRVSFDFVDVSLNHQSLATISLAIENVGPQFDQAESTLGTPEQLVELHKETQIKVQNEIKPNWRVWNWTRSSSDSKNPTDTSFKAWAEFGGLVGSIALDDRLTQNVVLRNRSGMEIHVPCVALSDEDWEWARNGRFWLTSRPDLRNKQLILKADNGREILLSTRDGKFKLRPSTFASLPADDQLFIERLRMSKKQSAALEPLEKWLNFASYIRK